MVAEALHDAISNRELGSQSMLLITNRLAEAVAWTAVEEATGLQAWQCDQAVEPHLVDAPWYIARKAARTAEEAAQASLLRHIIGNPFRPYPTPPHWPATLQQLAQSLYDGNDCTFALHDALLEAGHGELAEHFRTETDHPKGCWVVDLLLGKT